MNQSIRHVFVVNPAAGKKNVAPEIAGHIQAHAMEQQAHMYVTRGPGDATDYVRACAATTNERIRFYACGGDGTLHEVVNGAVGFAHASITAWPSGSGNDYVKYYGDPSCFLDFGALIAAQERKVDLMLVNGRRYAINMVHFGLDSAVAETMERVRRWPLLGGSNAYYTGATRAVVTSVRNAGEVSVDGQPINDGQLLLCTVACGRYVGGGFLTAPNSDNQDGLLDVLLVKPISRLRIPGLINLYKTGQHMESEKLMNDFIYRRGKEVHIRTPERTSQLLDGEIVHISDMRVEAVPEAIRFAVPGGL